MTLHFTSDTHFGDIGAINIRRRPFASLAEHDAALIARWNAVVAPDDEVWHLGDFGKGKVERLAAILGALNGCKHLVTGNIDTPALTALPGWASVQPYAELSLDGYRLVLCHYLPSWNGEGKGALNLHGHSHGRLKPLRRQVDVGVDVWTTRPWPAGPLQAAAGSARPPDGKGQILLPPPGACASVARTGGGHGRESGRPEEKAAMTRLEDLPYRPCVGLAIFNRAGQVFLGQRLSGPEHVDATHSWQMPRAASTRARSPMRRPSASCMRRPRSARW